MLVKNRKKTRLSLGNQAEDTLKLARIWETLTENSCPSNYNFHLHTNCSDGQLSPESLIEQAISLGLQGLAITDHHCIDGFYCAQQHLADKKFNSKSSRITLHLWTGIEITSLLNGTSVHILGYGFNPEADTLQQYLTGESPTGKSAQAKNVIQAIHEADGLVVLAHPSRYRRSARELILEAYHLGIDGIETYYAYGNPKPWQPSEQQTLTAKQMARQYNLYTTCGTDTHGSSILIRV